MDNKNESFSYTYSAKQQEELKHIREKYLPPKESKMEQLRRLDKRAENKGIIWSLCAGIIGTLIMGGGMSLVMVWENMIYGIPLGVAGLLLVGMAYPLYVRITKKQREKLAPQIIKLTDELMKNPDASQ